MPAINHMDVERDFPRGGTCLKFTNKLQVCLGGWHCSLRLVSPLNKIDSFSKQNCSLPPSHGGITFTQSGSWCGLMTNDLILSSRGAARTSTVLW